SRNTKLVPAAKPCNTPLERKKYTYAKAAKKNIPSTQAAKQIRFNTNCRRSSAVRTASMSAIESIQRQQNSAFARIDGMLSTAENASARASASGKYVSSSVR